MIPSISTFHTQNHSKAIEAEGIGGTQQVVMVLGEEKVHTEKKGKKIK